MEQERTFHLVDPSPWPVSTCIAVLLLCIGTVLVGHDCAPWGCLTLGGGAFWLAFSLWGWWRDVVIEAQTPGAHTPAVRQGFHYGMVIFILTEVMFFAAFFAAYFNAALSTPAPGASWPPAGIETIDPFGLPYINTLLLLLSGSLVTWAHHDLLENNIKGMIQKTGYSILLGICFLGVQALEYLHAPFGLTQGIYPSTFFMATGFHGCHVLIGVIFLSVCWWRARRNHFTADDHFGFEAAAWYWHFVDVVWLLLFVAVYWWGAL